MSLLKDFVDDLLYAVRSLRRTPGHTAPRRGHARAGDRLDDDTVQHGRCADLQAVPGAAPGQRPDPGEHDPRQRVRLASRIASTRTSATTRRSYDGVIANGALRAVGFSVSRTDTPRIRAGITVSGNYFRVLDVEAAAGKGLSRGRGRRAPAGTRGGRTRARFLEARIREQPFRDRQRPSG